MSFELKTRRFWRTQLPHWEVEVGYYFITIRTAGSLPRSVVANLYEIHRSLQSIEPSDDTFRLLQRRYFQTIENYADTGQGFCPFHDHACCDVLIRNFVIFEQAAWELPHYAIMPDHIHLLARVGFSSSDMHSTLSRWKGATSRVANKVLSHSGAFWQRDWFDRVVRNETELKRTIEYIQKNPVKGGLCTRSEDYPYVK